MTVLEECELFKALQKQIVEDRHFIKNLKKHVFENLCLTRDPETFHGCQPVSFLKEHASLLLKSDYYVCEKSDGIRYLLYFCQPPGLGLCCFLIDRNYNLIHIANSYLLSRSIDSETRRPFFQTETILDGELIVENGEQRTSKLVFLIFDCLMIEGENLCSLNLTLRQKAVQNRVILPNQNYSGVFELRQKEMAKPYALSLIFDKIQRQKHENDGLIFTPVYEPYSSGTSPKLLKWKPPELNSIDFSLGNFDSDNNVWQLLVKGERGLEYYSELKSPENALFIKNARTGMIVECSLVDNNWSFLRFRSDKESPNHIGVVKNIQKSIREGLTKEDLICLEKDIRSSWHFRNQAR